MQYKQMRTSTRTNQPPSATRWRSVLTVALLATVLCLFSSPAHAQNTVEEPDPAHRPIWRAHQSDTPLGLFPRLQQRLMRLRQAPLLLPGTVTAVEDGAVTIELKPLRAAGRFASERPAPMLARPVEFTFAVPEDALFFDGALNGIAPPDVAVGEAVTIVPELNWGRPAVRFLFQGTPQELRAYLHVGRLIQETDSSLLLQARGTETTVLLDEKTAWVDGGRFRSVRMSCGPDCPCACWGLRRQTAACAPSS